MINIYFQNQIEKKPKLIRNGNFIFLLKKLYLIFPKEINNNKFIEKENEIFTLTKLFEFKNLNNIPNSKENYILIKILKIFLIIFLIYLILEEKKIIKLIYSPKISKI